MRPKRSDRFSTYYRQSDDFHRYSMQHQDRVDAMTSFYRENHRFIGTDVVDIACGGGVLGFVLEPRGRRYTGIDINPDMIKTARAHARGVRSRNRFVLGDAARVRLKGRFDTATLLGNAVCHIDANQMVAIVQNFDKRLRRDASFIVDYRDVVGLLYQREWKPRIVQGRGGRRTETRTIGCDTERGVIVQKFGPASGRRRHDFSHAVWSPFIMEAVFRASGWRLRKRRERPSWRGWLDVYRRA